MTDIVPDQVPTFTSKTGHVFQLQAIQPVLLRRITSDSWGKPQPPIVESTVGKQKHKVKEANPNDPDYLQALREWEIEHKDTMLMYVIARGVCDNPPAQALEDLKQFLPGSTDAGLKYSWVLECLASDDELGSLVEAIVGLSVPTDKGIQTAEERFPGDGESETDQSVSTA